ncbi:MAG TPA: hypothetical protein VJ948_06065 [Acidimicrobiia bacterium]|nr:hypothetical protein [Acidimicrobiia bacterium]
MLWFEPLPYGRWALVVVIAVFALWVEFRPDATADQPFATVDIAPGETIDATNTEMRPVPDGLLTGADLGATAVRSITHGAPVLATDVGDPMASVPPGWWVVGVTLPKAATVGDDVRLVILDSGEEVAGVVAHPGSDDPFAAADGGVAVPPERSAEVALAAANGRLAVLVSTG